MKNRDAEYVAILASSVEGKNVRIKQIGFPKPGFHSNFHESILLIETELFVDHPAIQKWMQFEVIEIDTEDGEIIRGSQRKKGDHESLSTPEFHDDIPLNIIQTYRYLRYHNYALPFNVFTWSMPACVDYGIPKLVDMGWLKLKTGLVKKSTD